LHSTNYHPIFDLQMQKIVTIKEFFKMFTCITLMILAGFNFSIAQAGGKENPGIELFNEIAKQDSLLFNAFNNRDSVVFKNYFKNDLEFYHDKGGLTGYDQTIGFLRSTIISKNDIRRILERESMEVFPVPGYGAMQIGKHSFCHTENGRKECGTFKFVHIWQKLNGDWKISRVVSYDH